VALTHSKNIPALQERWQAKTTITEPANLESRQTNEEQEKP